MENKFKQSLFKKSTAFILSMSILISSIPMAVFAQQTAGSITTTTGFGDVDDNGNIDLEDVLALEEFFVDNEKVINLSNSDVNADGVIDELDLEKLRDYLAGNTPIAPELCKITFNTNSDDVIEPIYIGKDINYRGALPNPVKDGGIFLYWANSEGEEFKVADPLLEDITVSAVYQNAEIRNDLLINSFAVKNAAADFSISIQRYAVENAETSNEDIKLDELTYLSKNGKGLDELKITKEEDGTYTVSALDEFTPGSACEITLPEGIKFVGREDSIRTVYFDIEKAEQDTIRYNPKMKFIDKSLGDITVDMDNGAEPVNVIARVGDDATKAEVVTGTFTSTTQAYNVGDIVCIYDGEDPINRDYTKDSYSDDELYYVEITEVNGSDYKFELIGLEEMDKVFYKPNSIPYKVDELPDNIIGAKGELSKSGYDTSAIALLKMDTPEFNIGDIVAMYVGNFEDQNDNSKAVYGEITSVNGDVVTYIVTSREQIEDSMNMYVNRTLSEEDIDKIVEDFNNNNGEEQQALMEQVQSSDFASQASENMISAALQTDSVREDLKKIGVTESEISEMILNPSYMAAGGSSRSRTKFVVEQPTYSYSLSKGNHMEDIGSVGLTLSIGVVMTVSKTTGSSTTGTKTNSLVFDFTAGFTQEIGVEVAVDLTSDVSSVLWLFRAESICITTQVDLQSYTSASVNLLVYSDYDTAGPTNVNAAIVARDSLTQEQKIKFDKLKTYAKRVQTGWEKGTEIKDTYNEYLNKIGANNDDIKEILEVFELQEDLDEYIYTDVSEELKTAMSSESEEQNLVGLEKLMDKYQEMLEIESEWMVLVNKTLFEKEFLVKGLAINVKLDLSIKANVKMTIGADLEYNVGKRYTFWIDLAQRTSGSSEIDLIDERFAFQFYIMGAIGLRMGITASLDVGLLSTKLGSIGANVEFGPYLQLNGYFIYIYERTRLENTNYISENEELMGALCVEFGIYLKIKAKAQLLADSLMYDPVIYEGSYPLLYAGEKINTYDFSFIPENNPINKDILYIRDTDDIPQTGINMLIPNKYLAMKNMDLMTGERGIGQVGTYYDREKFIYTSDNSKIEVDEKGNLTAKPETGDQYIEANIRVVWKSDKLAFSKYDVDITIPVVWTYLNEEEVTTKHTATVYAGNLADGYDAIWVGNYTRLETFDLPTQEEVLELLDYDSYNYGDINLKYDTITGYDEPSTNLQITNDKKYYFDISERQYTLTITDILKVDNTTETRTYKAKYGEDFDVSDLENTGVRDTEKDIYKSFSHIENADGTTYESLNANLYFVDGEISNTQKAVYADNSRTATFTFVGIDAPDYKVIFEAGTAPSLAGIEEHIQKYDSDSSIGSYSPEVVRSESSSNYKVICNINELIATAERYTFTALLDDGTVYYTQECVENAKIYNPKTPKKVGYTFMGWYLGEENFFGNSAYVEMGTSNIEVTAKWEPIKYTVRFVNSHTYGNNIIVDFDSAIPDVTYGSDYSKIIPKLNTENGDAFKFLGWYTKPQNDSEGAVELDGSSVVTGNAIYYAWWAEKATVDLSHLNNACIKQYIYYPNSTFSVTLADLRYFGGTIPSEIEKSIKFSYDYLGDNNRTDVVDPGFITDEPTEAGEYRVKLTFEGNTDYEPFIIELNGSGTYGALSVDRMSLSEEYGDSNGKLPNPEVVTAGGTLVFLTPDYLPYDVVKEVDFIYHLGGDGHQKNPQYSGLGGGSHSIRLEILTSRNYYGADSNIITANVPGAISMNAEVKFEIKTADVAWGGTNDDMYGYAYGVNGGMLAGPMMNHSGNDFEGGDLYTYTICDANAQVTPWELTDFAIGKYGEDNWTMGYLKVFVNGYEAINYTTQTQFAHDTESSQTVNVNTDDAKSVLWYANHHFTDLKTRFARNVGLTSNFPTVFANSNIELGDTIISEELAWDGRIQDQYNANYYCYSYPSAPELVVTVTSNDQYKAPNPDYLRFLKRTSLTGFKVDEAGLWEYMQKIGDYNSFKYTIQMKFPDNTSNTTPTTTLPITVPAPKTKTLVSSYASESVHYSQPIMLSSGEDTSTGKITFSAEDSKANVGDVVGVPIAIKNTTDIWGVWNEITFDRNALELESWTVGDIFAYENITVTDDLSTGNFKFVATNSNLENTSLSGTILTLWFKIKEEADGSIQEISITNLQSINASSEVQDTTTNSPKITIGTLMGDTDVNYKISVLDASLLAKYLLVGKVEVITQQGLGNADVTHDQEITIEDLVKIKKFLVDSEIDLTR